MEESVCRKHKIDYLMSYLNCLFVKNLIKCSGESRKVTVLCMAAFLFSLNNHRLNRLTAFVFGEAVFKLTTYVVGKTLTATGTYVCCFVSWTGLGYTMVSQTFFTAVYYNLYQAWILRYLLGAVKSLFFGRLPWTMCASFDNKLMNKLYYDGKFLFLIKLSVFECL